MNARCACGHSKAYHGCDPEGCFATDCPCGWRYADDALEDPGKPEYRGTGFGFGPMTITSKTLYGLALCAGAAGFYYLLLDSGWDWGRMVAFVVVINMGRLWQWVENR